ncbi:MAG TPA: glutathione peroxidase [Elusimicrobiota bacterium]|jgi:glutathione peroxidase|nr:glutathione peroxidase [Elusimicrobiota bacterium]
MSEFARKAGLSAANVVFGAKERLRRIRGGLMKTTAAPAGKIYSFEMKTIDGRTKKLEDYKGQVLLVVNTASQCGYTPQYEGLEKLYERFKDKGLKVLAFPANEFGAQEPGTDAEISQFCRTKYSTTFDLFSKIKVKGEGIHPLYKFLTTESGHNGEIPWNFAKFLVGRRGEIADRFGPDTEPLSKTLVGRIESLLAES